MIAMGQNPLSKIEVYKFMLYSINRFTRRDIRIVTKHLPTKCLLIIEEKKISFTLKFSKRTEGPSTDGVQGEQHSITSVVILPKKCNLPLTSGIRETKLN